MKTDDHRERVDKGRLPLVVAITVVVLGAALVLVGMDSGGTTRHGSPGAGHTQTHKKHPATTLGDTGASTPTTQVPTPVTTPPVTSPPVTNPPVTNPPVTTPPTTQPAQWSGRLSPVTLGMHDLTVVSDGWQSCNLPHIVAYITYSNGYTWILDGTVTKYLYLIDDFIGHKLPTELRASYTPGQPLNRCEAAPAGTW